MPVTVENHESVSESIAAYIILKRIMNRIPCNDGDAFEVVVEAYRTVVLEMNSMAHLLALRICQTLPIRTDF